LTDYIDKEVLPALSTKQIYGGRVSNTFIIPTTSELYQQIVNHVKKAKLRIMINSDYDLFFELKDILIRSITRIISSWKKKNIILRDEDRRDRFALIVCGKNMDKNLKVELPERLRIAFDPSEIQTNIIVVDDVVFISNINTGFGISLRINDKTVASTYAVLLTHIYLEKQINLYGTDDIIALGKHISKENDIKDSIQYLLNQGWKIIPEHTNSTEISDELGLAATGSERAFFRLCGIRYFPFTTVTLKQEQVQVLFEDTFKRGLAYIQRVRKQLKIHGKKDKRNIFGHDCNVYWIEYEQREEWAPILGDIPKLEDINEKGEGIVIATFNFNDKAAMSVWGINPNNVIKIL
jgi:ribulose bisphosphate carboxylase small subunit